MGSYILPFSDLPWKVKLKSLFICKPLGHKWRHLKRTTDPKMALIATTPDGRVITATGLDQCKRCRILRWTW